MSRLPIRLRLTLAFTLALATVLAVTGAFLYFRLGASLDETINDGLENRAAGLTAQAARGDTGLRDAPLEDETFAQVLGAEGEVVDSTPQVGGEPLLEPAEVRQALAEGEFMRERDHVPGIEGRARLLATAVGAQGSRRVLVVGSTLEERDDAVRGLLGELVVVGPAALVVASLLGYALATAALRPVEAMRSEAASISGAERGRRLPLPRARDEIHRLGVTLNDMLARLEAALVREQTFVADASHELRTPLALLKAELELALRQPRSAEELEQAVRSAAAETERLVRLAEGLLVLARSDQGRLGLHAVPHPAAALLASVAERFRPEAERAGRPLEVAAPPGLEVVGDVVRIEQAVGNLVENALRHGGGAIRLTAVARDSVVELHVLDEGGGFPPEFLPHAFERFGRADEARSGDGAGLGLAIVEVIAGAHEGSAGAANREEGGADVWLSVPGRTRVAQSGGS